MQGKPKQKRRNILICGLLSLLMVFGVSVAMVGAGPSARVYAAGNSPIHTLTGTETHSHTVQMNLWGNATDYTESYYKNTGIQIYGTSNSGSTTTGNAVSLDSSSFYVDFTGANGLYEPSNILEDMCYTLSYSFEIYSSSGYRQWYAKYSSNAMEVDEAPYTLTYNINGSTTTKTDADGTLTMNFNPSEFGKRLVSLYGTNYTWKITRTYYWATNNPQIAIYTSSSSMSGTLMIDTTKPTLSAVGNTTGGTITSGSYVNQLVKFTSSDTNFYRIYYKRPGYSSFTSTSSTTYTSTALTGWWTVYSQDKVGNKSNEFTFYYDATKPVGSISSNGTTVASGSYVNKSFAYTVTDSGSGIKQIYYKSPVSGSYQTYASGTIIPASAGDGWYYFYAVDNSGNQSSTMSVYLETASPLVEIYRNGGVAYSTTITDSGTYDTGIYMNRNDIMKITYESSSGNVTSNYALNSNITIGDSYTASDYTITLTTPTGINAKYVFHVVDEVPYITIDNKKYESGATIFLKDDAFVSWFDDSDITDSAETGVNIVSEGDNTATEFIKYSQSSGKTLTTTEDTETKYVLTLNDRAGNVSTFTIYVDKNPVDAIWKVGEETIENGGYVNTPISLEILENTATATYSKNGGEYQPYISNQVLSEEGVYNVVVVDRAGNKSTYVINVDYTAPTGSLYANYQEVENGTITNQKIYFSWDGENTATINGNEYVKNSVISADGIYEFVLKDKAGNTSVYNIQIDTVSPEYNKHSVDSNKDFTVAKWYNVEFDGVMNTFASYESALEFASQKEFESFVTELELTDVESFTQYHLVATKGNPEDEVKVGTYYRYKSQANASNELYYFDTELLNEVITHYAKNYISEINYFDLENNEYGELADNMFDNIWLTNDVQAPCVNGFVFEQVDSNEVYAQLVGSGEGQVKVEFGVPFEEQFTITGLYEITEIDKAGNISTYFVFLDLSAPELVVDAEVFGAGSSTKITITKDSIEEIGAYYYKSFNVNSIVDNDSWATIMIENEGIKTYFSKGDELPSLNVGGEYLVSVYDRLGNSYSFTVYIVGNEASVTFTPNSDSTEFNINITLEQEFDTVVSLEIYKDGEMLEGVSTDILNYTYTKDGVYTVVIRDNFGRIIERTYDFNKSLPNGSLTIDNGGRTTEEVVFTFDSEKYYAEVSLNGVIVSTDYDGEIKVNEDGSYVIKLVNVTDEENFNEYSFTIDTVSPNIVLTGVEQGGTTNSDVVVGWSDMDVVSSTYTINGGEEVVFDNNTTFTDEGIYVVTVVDDLGNTSTVIFTIDKTLDYDIYVNDSATTGVDRTNQEVTVVNNENLTVSVTKNGSAYEYSFSDVLSEEGVYAFRIYDEYGNVITFQIIIDKSVDVYATTGDGMISNEGVIISAGEKVNVIVTKDGQEYPYTIGQEITEDGSYKVTVYDTYGNEKTIYFQIVNGTKTELDYTLGENVEIVSVTKDGEAIEWDSNSMNFTEDGTYVITAKVDGIEYTFELSLDTTAPEITLNGIEDGDTANVTVTITDMTEEGTIEVYKDGEKIEYNLGDEIKDYGSYEIKVTDELGNERTYTFTLEYQMNGWAIALIVIGVLAIAGLVVLIVLKKRRVFKK